MRLSKKSRYGIRVMLYLAKNKKICSAKEISEKEKIPFYLLEKILFAFYKNGLIQSKQGREGGYFLLKPAERITMLEILKVFEGDDIFSVSCSKRVNKKKSICPIRDFWKAIQKQLVLFLVKTTLADLEKRKIKF